MPAIPFLELAARGLRMPNGVNLVLHEEPHVEIATHDPEKLGRVVERAARRYGTALAFPLMDLTLEKADLLTFLGVRPADIEPYHFMKPPSVDVVALSGQRAGGRSASDIVPALAPYVTSRRAPICFPLACWSGRSRS